MKKILAFGCPLTAFVAAALALRRAQRLSDFGPDGLLSPGLFTYALVALVVVAAVGFYLLSRLVLQDTQARGPQRREKPTGYLAFFALPHPSGLFFYLLAGGLLVGAGLLGIRAHQAGLNSQMSDYIFSIALVPTGLDLALVGWLNTQKEEAQGRFAWPLLIPGWCGCVWLISAYQAHTALPNPMAYAFYLLGILSALGACYTVASFSFERPRPLATAWLCAMALVLLSTAMADALTGGDKHQLLVCLGYMVYLAVQMKCLLYRAQVSADLIPWEPPTDDEKTEVSEDE